MSALISDRESLCASQAVLTDKIPACDLRHKYEAGPRSCESLPEVPILFVMAGLIEKATAIQ
jgi:hypothetical protein